MNIKIKNVDNSDGENSLRIEKHKTNNKRQN